MSVFQGAKWEPFEVWLCSSMLLLLLSRVSCVRLCGTPQTAAHQAPLSLGFSRQEHWSGLPFPSPMHESENESEVAQCSPTLRDPMDCSLLAPPSIEFSKARVLEWGAMSFSMFKYERDLFATTWFIACCIHTLKHFSLTMNLILVIQFTLSK